MKLILPLTLVWALSSTAGALMCQTCTDLLCLSTASVTCSSETMCVAASIQGSLSGSTLGLTFRACASSEVCPVTGNQMFSISSPLLDASASARCCNTNDCNSGDPPSLGPQTDNSLRCCSMSQCVSSLQCQGVEDSCFNASVTSGSTTLPVFGCASSNLCASAAFLSAIPVLQSAGDITSGPACCGASLCNADSIMTTHAATTTTAAVTTTTAAMTTTSAAVTTTTAAMTTTSAAVTTTTTASACTIGPAMIHLLLGLFLVNLC